jgi:uncharacterized protein
MRYYRATNNGMILVIFDRGDMLLEGLAKLASREGIETAAITAGIGSFDICHLHWITSTGIPPTNEFLTLEGPVEVVSILGSIIGGEPHIHICVSDLDRTYTGHLEPGSRICYRAELCLQPLEGVSLKSQFNEATGLVEIVPT